MKQDMIQLQRPCSPAEQEELVARLTRHLEARLRDFGPGGPEVLRVNQSAGLVSARFPGHPAHQVLSQLEQRGFSAALERDEAVFYLSPHISFEALDRLWGCLFDLL